jgi:asparagine synthase (glutamine-hydrolysing)
LDDEVTGLLDARIPLHPRRIDADDTRGYLREILLADADVFGMANGVEVRVPFVDRELRAAARRAEVRSKRDLVAAFDDPLLAERLAGRKHGFVLPVGRWLEGPLSGLVGRLLDDPPSCLRCAIDPGGVASLVHGWRSGLGPHASEVWVLVTLYQWGDRLDALSRSSS